MVITRKKGKLANVGEDREDLEASCLAGGNVKWCSLGGKLLGGLSVVPSLRIEKN